MTSQQFATQLLADVQLTIAGTTGTSAQIAAAVNQTISNDFLRESTGVQSAGIRRGVGQQLAVPAAVAWR